MFLNIYSSFWSQKVEIRDDLFICGHNTLLNMLHNENSSSFAQQRFRTVIDILDSLTLQKNSHSLQRIFRMHDRVHHRQHFPWFYLQNELI